MLPAAGVNRRRCRAAAAFSRAKPAVKEDNSTEGFATAVSQYAPLGNIMRVRKEVYRHSSILRHKLNQQERTEPHSADELLAVKLGADRSWRRPADPATSGS